MSVSLSVCLGSASQLGQAVNGFGLIDEIHTYHLLLLSHLQICRPTYLTYLTNASVVLTLTSTNQPL